MSSSQEIQIEILILGDTDVGKTSFLKSVLSQQPKKYPVTTSVQIYQKQHCGVKFKFYDTPGKELYSKDIKRQLSWRQYPYEIVIYMFSFENLSSLKNIEVWKKKFRLENAANIILIGNKYDIKQQQVVSEAEEIKQQFKNKKYYKSNLNTHVDSDNHPKRIMRNILEIFIQQVEFIDEQPQNNQKMQQQQQKPNPSLFQRTLIFLKSIKSIIFCCAKRKKIIQGNEQGNQPRKRKHLN